MTNREEHYGYGERDSCEHGETHTQDESVIRVDSAVGVEELRLHFTW